MQLDRQAVALRRVEHARRLCGRKANGFAESVNSIDQTFRSERGQHIGAEMIDVVIRTAGEFGGHGMRAEERRAHAHRQ